MAALLVFILATLDAKGSSGGNVFKNPAGYIYRTKARAAYLRYSIRNATELLPEVV